MPGKQPFPTGELTELEAYCNAELGTRGDAWNPPGSARPSKAPELLISTKGEAAGGGGGQTPASGADGADGERDEDEQVSWFGIDLGW